MTVEARAKINWTLQIVGRRDDGYHLLDSVMQHIDLSDTLVFEPSDRISLHVANAQDPIPADERNLVFRAALALQKASGTKKGAAISLTKRTPSGAGLGGGSADAAAALKALDRFWDLHMTLEQLCQIGCSLGADIPYCLQTAPMRVNGIGEVLSPLPFSIPNVPLVLLKDAVSLSTKEIFQRLDEEQQTEIKSRYTDAWLSWIARPFKRIRPVWNDLERVSLPLVPGIARAKEDLYDCGACFAQMTGSGSAVYGVFEDDAMALACQKKLQSAYPVCLLCHTC